MSSQASVDQRGAESPPYPHSSAAALLRSLETSRLPEYDRPRKSLSEHPNFDAGTMGRACRVCPVKAVQRLMQELLDATQCTVIAAIRSGVQRAVHQGPAGHNGHPYTTSSRAPEAASRLHTGSCAAKPVRPTGSRTPAPQSMARDPDCKRHAMTAARDQAGARARLCRLHRTDRTRRTMVGRADEPGRGGRPAAIGLAAPEE